MSERRYRTAALAALTVYYLVLISGATVRVTGSGLGCKHWPGCKGGHPLPPLNHQSLIEFGNRMVVGAVTIVGLVLLYAAFRTHGITRTRRRLALSVVALTIVQIALGPITVYFDLNPLLVGLHFVLSLVLVALVVALALDALGLEPRALGRPLERTWLAVLGLSAGVLVVTGTLVTAAGPHSGSKDTSVTRFGNFEQALYVHVRAAAVFGVLLLGLVVLLRRSGRTRELRLGFAALGLAVVQMAVGEAQYRTGLPWWLVLIHVGLAGALWGSIVALVMLCGLSLRREPRVESSARRLFQ
jgi:cytochrome c oxidase assembly protein subunit 15